MTPPHYDKFPLFRNNLRFGCEIVFQVGFRAQTKNGTEISEVDPLLLARVTNGFSVLMGQHQLHPFVFTTKPFS